MPKRRILPADFIPPCEPVLATKPPSGPGWAVEIKHDGYRLQVRRDGERVRIFTRRGYDWTDRFPTIAATALKLKARSFVIDGEGVVAGPDGIAAFDMMHGHRRYHDAFLSAFDLLELNGVDIRPLSFIKRKVKLALLLALSSAGIVLNEHIEADGAAVFAEACRMGLEGIVSKRIDKPYRSGKSGDWVKVRNPNSAAAKRFAEGQKRTERG